MGRFKLRADIAVVLLALLAVVGAACGSKSTTTSSQTPTPSASVSATAAFSPSSGSAEEAIAGAWTKFFSGTTPAAAKIGLLQGGQSFAQVIKAQAASALAKSTEAKVVSVTVTSPTTATVKYSILLGGQVALADQTGQAIKSGGAWQVSAKSFTNLLKLEGQGASNVPTPSPTN